MVAGAAGAQGGGAEDFLSFGCIAHDQEPTRETMDMDNEHGPFFCCFFFTTNSSRKEDERREISDFHRNESRANKEIKITNVYSNKPSISTASAVTSRDARLVSLNINQAIHGADVTACAVRRRGCRPRFKTLASRMIDF